MTNYYVFSLIKRNNVYMYIYMYMYMYMYMYIYNAIVNKFARSLLINIFFRSKNNIIFCCYYMKKTILHDFLNIERFEKNSFK